MINQEGVLVETGTIGEIAFYTPGDPIGFLNYWNKPKGAQEKYAGD